MSAGKRGSSAGIAAGRMIGGAHPAGGR